MSRSFTDIESDFRSLSPSVAFCSLRVEREFHEWVSVVRNSPRPISTQSSLGGMVTIYTDGGYGYAATPDLSRDGIARAIDDALEWAKHSEGKLVPNLRALTAPPSPNAQKEIEFQSPVEKPWSDLPTQDKFDLLQKANETLKSDDAISNWGADLWYTDKEVVQIFANGPRQHQRFAAVTPGLWATAHKPGKSQTRSFGRDGVQQGGLEVLDRMGWQEATERVAQQALALLAAPDCPTGDMDVVIAGDQMVLQIHESIGHPLELDRVLGDERNYAGTSFVTPDMVGAFQYGSELLNITFDPQVDGEAASYAFDDEGTKAEKQHLIHNGKLVRLLGGATSQARAGMTGVANTRAAAWNRPPIDRMANINLEAGDSSLDELISGIENGVYMETNRSWSIDDSRNKFQFGCEWAERIVDGERTEVLSNANYRGISREFWQSLSGVGDIQTLNLGGSPYCGKGEPNQAVRVGHRTPACQFRNVSVFGGMG